MPRRVQPPPETRDFGYLMWAALVIYGAAATWALVAFIPSPFGG